MSHIGRQCLVFVVFVCFECKLDQHIRFGEAGVAVSWLGGGDYVFVFEEIIDCLLK